LEEKSAIVYFHALINGLAIVCACLHRSAPPSGDSRLRAGT